MTRRHLIETDKSIYRKELEHEEIFKLKYSEKIIGTYLYEKNGKQCVVLVIEKQNYEDISSK